MSYHHLGAETELEVPTTAGSVTFSQPAEWPLPNGPVFTTRGPAPSLVQSVQAQNPKDAIGTEKLPLHLWPETASMYGCLAMLDGALKYGRSNFRQIGIRASIYFDAQKRHMNAWFEGEDNDPDSGLPHLAHALACIAIIIEAQTAGRFHDDRQTKTRYRELVQELTPHVARLKAVHASKAPRHFTIADSQES